MTTCRATAPFRSRSPSRSPLRSPSHSPSRSPSAEIAHGGKGKRERSGDDDENDDDDDAERPPRRQRRADDDAPPPSAPRTAPPPGRDDWRGGGGYYRDYPPPTAGYRGREPLPREWRGAPPPRDHDRERHYDRDRERYRGDASGAARLLLATNRTTATNATPAGHRRRRGTAKTHREATVTTHPRGPPLEDRARASPTIKFSYDVPQTRDR